MLTVLANTMVDWTPVLTFTAYIVKAQIQRTATLSTSQAFTSLALIALVTDPAVGLIQAIPQLTASMANFTRLQNYLLSDAVCDHRLGPELAGPTRVVPTEHPDGVELITLRPKSLTHDASKAIEIKNATIRPTPKAPAALEDINFSISHGELVLVNGPIGSGKSTLLQAILGELPCESGSLTVSSKRMAYCSQTSWILNTSIQQIVCGLSRGSVDERWYQKVLHTCALDDDIGRLSDGDLSIVGSKGFTLSGGQKQRLVSTILPFTVQSDSIQGFGTCCICKARHHLVG